MKKRGQSQIITTVLIILLVLAAIIIVWQVVSKIIRDNSEDINVDNINLELTGAYINPADDSLKVTIKRYAGKGDLTLIKVILKDSENQYIKTLTTDDDLPEELETKTYEFTPSAFELSDFSNIVEVSIAYGTTTSSGKTNLRETNEKTSDLRNENNNRDSDKTITDDDDDCNDGSTRTCSGSDPCKNYQETCVDGKWDGNCVEINNKVDGDSCSVNGESGTCEKVDEDMYCVGEELIDVNDFDTNQACLRITTEDKLIYSRSDSICCDISTAIIPFVASQNEDYRLAVDVDYGLRDPQTVNEIHELRFDLIGSYVTDTFTWEIGGLEKPSQITQQKIITAGTTGDNFVLYIKNLEGCGTESWDVLIFNEISLRKVLQ